MANRLSLRTEHRCRAVVGYGDLLVTGRPPRAHGQFGDRPGQSGVVGAEQGELATDRQCDRMGGVLSVDGDRQIAIGAAPAAVVEPFGGRERSDACATIAATIVWN